MQEHFAGCRVLSYRLMDNHLHRLPGVPLMAEVGILDVELLKRLTALRSEAFVADVAKELEDARTAICTSNRGMDEAVLAICKRFTYCMQDLGEFMKGLLQWFNRAQSSSGTLCEDRFNSVIVEAGVAVRTMAA